MTKHANSLIRRLLTTSLLFASQPIECPAKNPHVSEVEANRCEHDVLTVKVESLARAGGHSGTTTRERFTLVAPGTGIDTLFVKITPVGWAQRVFGHAMRLGEMGVRFYQQLVSQARRAILEGRYRAWASDFLSRYHHERPGPETRNLPE